VRSAKASSRHQEEQFAKRAKVSRAYVAVLEAGHRKNPSPEILKRLAKALGVSRGDLLA